MKDCNIVITGKNDQVLARGPVQLPSEDPTGDQIISALWDMPSSILNDAINKNNKESLDVLGKLNIESWYPNSSIVGNFNGIDIVKNLKSKGVRLSNRTLELLDLANEILKDNRYILVNNRGLINTNNRSVKGALKGLRTNNPVIVLDGTDAESIDNTLQHELLHLLWNIQIENDKELQNKLMNLYEVLKTKRKTVKELDPVLKLISMDLKPTEVFAYLFSDSFASEYIKENLSEIWKDFDNLMPIIKPKYNSIETNEKAEGQSRNTFVSIAKDLISDYDNITHISDNEIELTKFTTAGIIRVIIDRDGNISGNPKTNYDESSKGELAKFVSKVIDNNNNLKNAYDKFNDIYGDLSDTDNLVWLNGVTMLEGDSLFFYPNNSLEYVKVTGDKISFSPNFPSDSLLIDPDSEEECKRAIVLSFLKENKPFFKTVNLPFKSELSFLSDEHKLPRLVRSSNGYGYSNIEEAYNYYEERKETSHRYWSTKKPVNSDFQARQIKTGDIIQTNIIQYLKKGEAKRLGIANNEWQLPVHLNEVMTYFEKLKDAYDEDPSLAKEMLKERGFDKMTDSKIKSLLKAQKVFLNKKSNIENRYKKKNYISGGVFYDKELKKWCTYIPLKFKDDVGQVRMPLTIEYINNTRSLSNEFKTNYEYENGKLVLDEDGNPVVKQVKSNLNFDEISNEDIALAKQGVEIIKMSKKDLDSLSKAKQKLLETGIAKEYATKNGKSFLSSTKYGVMFSGYSGDLDEQVMEASAGDIVIYQAGWNNKKPIVKYGSKVKNIAGGIIIIDEDGKPRDISADAVTSVIFNKNLIKESLIQEAKQLNQLFDKRDTNYNIETGFKADPKVSIYPFFNHDEDEDGNGLKYDRKEMSKNLKKGDLIKIRYWSNSLNKYIESIVPIMHITSTKIYYTTTSEEYPVMSVDIDYYTNDNWYKKSKKSDWVLGTKDSNGKIIPAKYKKTQIIAAFAENRQMSVTMDNYLRERLNILTKAYKNKKIQKLQGQFNLNDLASSLLGSSMSLGIKIVDGVVHLPLSKSSLEDEWDITDLSELDMASRIDALSDLVPGDIIKMSFTSKDGHDRTFYSTFRGYNKETGMPMTEKNDNVDINRVVSVGKRTLPIVSFVYNGEEIVTTLDLDGVAKLKENKEISQIHVLTEGRVDKYNRLKESIKNFVTKDRKQKLMTKEEFNANKEILDRFNNTINGTEWKVERIECKAYRVNDEIVYAVKKPEGGKIIKNEPSMYKARVYKVDNESSGYYLTNMDFDESKKTLFGAGKKSFDEMQEILTEGDIVTMEYKTKDVSTGNETTGYRECVVTKITGTSIEGSYFAKAKEMADDGESIYIPKQITWYSTRDNMRITNAKIQNLKKVYNRKLKEESKSKKPKQSKMTRKSFDSKEAVSLVSQRIESIYGVKTNMLDQKGMNELGEKHSIDFTKTRAAVIDGEIYINLDLASTADVLHELTHILLPGLKATNPELYSIVLSKVSQHPEYETIREAYSNLSDEDLAEEVFCTIFGEYYRKEMLSKDEEAWLSGEFSELTNSVPKIVSNIFDVNAEEVPTEVLMTMTLEDIMNDFGSSLITGDLKTTFNHGLMIENNSYVSKIYQSLIDSGNLIRMC